MKIFIEGIGVLGSGLNGWQASQATLAGAAPYVQAALVMLPSDLLPPAERRRTGVPVKLALAVGCEAIVELWVDRIDHVLADSQQVFPAYVLHVAGPFKLFL